MSIQAVVMIVSAIPAGFCTSGQVNANPREAVTEPEIIVENVTYGTDAIPLPGILARPANLEGKAPAILAMHGGGNSGLQRAMKWLIEGLAKRGYVGLSGTYRPPTHPQREDLADCKMALDYLVSLPYVDAEKIGMAGQSRGAGNSYRTAVHDTRIKSIAPISTSSARMPGIPLPDRRELSEQRFMEGIRGTGGYPEELSGESTARSSRPPVNPLDVKVPVLAIQGTWDLHAPAEGAISVKAAAEKAGIDHIHVQLIPGMGHFFDTPKGVLTDEMIALVADWFDETLRGKKTGRDFRKPIELPDDPTFPPSEHYTVKEVSYQSEGHEVPAYLLEPRGALSYRGVLYAPDGHTGAEATRLGFLIEALAESGNVVLVTRYRGEIGDVTDDADLAAGLDYLSSLPQVKKEGFVIVGHGRGGMTALRNAAKDERVKAVAALGAPANVTRLIKGLEAYSPAAAEFQASRLAGSEHYRALSPQYYARDIKVPVLLVHGTLDLMVAPEHMLWNAVALMTTGNTEVEIYMPPWDIHHFDSTFAYLRPEQWVGRITSWIETSARINP
jgi:dipeptidyl aminopeptidase/acylaminoacyl peptidase